MRFGNLLDVFEHDSDQKIVSISTKYFTRQLEAKSKFDIGEIAEIFQTFGSFKYSTNDLS